MFDNSTILWLLAGFGFLLLVRALLDAGMENSAGMFPQGGVRDWPHGVQEMDVPRFAVEHLDALRPDASPVQAPRHPAHLSRRAI